MQRSRRGAKRTPIVESSSDSDDDIPLKKLYKPPVNKNVSSKDKTPNGNNSSSSESDIENYLQPVDKIDLSSAFFNVQKKNEQEEFEKIEKSMFATVTRLSDSDSDEDMDEVEPNHLESKQNPKPESLGEPSTSTASVGTKLNFQQLEEYTRKIEEAKKHVEEYNARKKIEESNMDISNLLAAGESKRITLENIKPEDLHSSDFESCDSEQENWEEVKVKDSQELKEKNEEKSLVPKDGLQITLNMPDTCRKKKGVDLLAAMKRRLNRIRKENQVYVHKVHLLCWIAHGNYVNETLNKSEILTLALSLLPSDKCYPADRTDLGYLEQIVQWYKGTIKLTEKAGPKKMKLDEVLQRQIGEKRAFNKKILVYIFIAILRSLGIQCRLVLSFQVEPLRPPASELHSLAKEIPQKSPKSQALKVEEKSKKETSKVKDKSSNAGLGKDKKGQLKKAEKETSKVKDKSSNADLGKDKKGQVRTSEKETSKVKDKSSNADFGKDKKGQVRTSERETSKDKDKSSNADLGKDKKGQVRTSERETSKVKDKSSNADLGKDKKGQVKISVKETSKVKDKSSNADLGKDKKGQIKKSEKETSKVKAKSSNADLGKNKKDQLKIDVSDKTSKDKNIRSKSAENGIKDKPSEKNSVNSLNVQDLENKRRSKSVGNTEEKTARPKAKSTAKKEIIKIKLPKKGKQKDVAQLDGVNNSSDDDITFDFIPQLDGADDNKNKPKAKKPNLKKLNTPSEGGCKVKKHLSRLKSVAEDDNSADEFRPRSPLTKKNSGTPKSSQLKVNLHRLRDNPVADKNKSHHFSSSPKKQMDVKNDIINLIKGRIAEQKHIDRSRMVTKRKLVSNQTDSDSDYMPEPVKKKHHDSDSDLDYFVPKPKVKKRVSVQRNSPGTKIISSDSDPDKSGKKKKTGNDVWVEVFLESEEKWISVDVVQGQVHCVNELYTRATHPVSYIVAWNNDNRIKDVTRRYCTNFNTITRKLRIDAKWWEESIKPFLGKSTARDKEEDDDLNRQQLDQPLPKSITEYKNHPLYALRRHLLKFEDIYPPNIQPLGYVRGEPIYPRNCVYVCRSRDIWLKEARVVKPGEKPYKIVKARPKYDKLSNQVITDQLLEIFGEWQTMDYDPPTAENGVVPRNAFGNVELFKPCMLPKGTVHLKLPGLNKICRRMDIDCASAIVGFDFHCGWSHPMYDGFVVCEEFADSLVAAWELEQEELERKENEKVEKRVYGNWKKLIKGLLIRERLKARYNFGGASTSGEGGKEKKKAKGPRLCTKKRRMYSDSESESDKT